MRNVMPDQVVRNRLAEIDGIRGWAALVVLVYHFIFFSFIKKFPQFFFPHFILFDGVLAVQIFFILSGDALTAGYFKTGDRRIIDSLLCKRYLRLTMPILFSCATVYLIMKAGYDYHSGAAPLIGRESWLGMILPFQADFVSMIQYAFFNVYAGHKVVSSYNPFLWTMSIEFLGSLMVFLFLYVSKRIQSIVLALVFVLAALLLIAPDYASFFVGVLFGYSRHCGIFERLHTSEVWRYINRPLFALLIIAALFFPMVRLPVQMDTVHAAAWVFYASPKMLSFFRNRVSQFLGALSFPLYVMHFAVLISVTSYLIIWFDKNGGLSAGAISLIVLASFVSSFAAAWLLRQIEIPYLRQLGILVDYVLKGRDGSRQS
jgi:peptidoglycan/LPS O-acetylase OafA/YrhL